MQRCKKVTLFYNIKKYFFNFLMLYIKYQIENITFRSEMLQYKKMKN